MLGCREARGVGVVVNLSAVSIQILRNPILRHTTNKVLKTDIKSTLQRQFKIMWLQISTLIVRENALICNL